MHATILKGNLGYVQYTVPNDCSCRTYFCYFPLAPAHICPWPPVPFFQMSLRTVHSKPPTISFGIVACTFSDNLSRNSFIRLVCQFTRKKGNMLSGVYLRKTGNGLYRSNGLFTRCPGDFLTTLSGSLSLRCIRLFYFYLFYFILLTLP